jgi:hypothetical protein
MQRTGAPTMNASQKPESNTSKKISLLEDLQRLLERLYGVRVGADVQDFVISDRTVADRLSGSHTQASECLMLVQSEDALDLALYLDREILQRLEENDPRDQLNDANLADFCIALEGVSHFNYVALSAARERAVTLMELELQAEVDKYVAAWLLAGSHSLGDTPSERLLVRMFDAYRLGRWLDVEAKERYRVASDFAGRYCASLERRFSEHNMTYEMLADVRCFYRQAQPGKVSHIARVQLA